MLYNKDVQESEYLSPGIFVDDDVLKKFPQTMFVVGSQDPFKDDIYRFMDRMLEIGVEDVVMKEFRMLSHGFLGYNPEIQGEKSENE